MILIETSVGAAPPLYSTPDTFSTCFRTDWIVSTSKIELVPCIMQARRSSPSPVSILGCGRSVYDPSSSLLNWVNTRFQNSVYLSQSQPGLQSGLPHPCSSPLSKYISEQGPHGPPVPISQKLSSLPSLTIFSSGRPIMLCQRSNASSSFS